jgi:hypothetical protein
MSDQTNGEAANNERFSLKIQGTTFEIKPRFYEGYSLKSNEADAMNGLLGENVRNNLATRVRDYKLAVAGWSPERIKGAKVEEMAPAVDGVNLSSGQIAELQETIDEYVSTYEFGFRTGRTKMTPLEREMDIIISNMLDNALKAKGYSPSKMQKDEKEKYNGLYERVKQANFAAIEAEAKKRIESLANIAEATLDLDTPVEQEAAE